MNVIVIVNDSYRPDHLGCYGNDWIKTPNVDAFAKESMVFENAYAEGLPTVPVRTAWFTGRYTFPFRGWQRLEPTDILLGEILWDKGYNSAYITDAYHLHKPTMAFERGFDYVKFVRGHEGDPHILDKSIPIDTAKYHKDNENDPAGSKKTLDMLEQYLRNRHDWKDDSDTFVAKVVKEGVKWLEEQEKRDNLFLWLDCFDPHEPWDPMPPFDTMYTDPKYNGQPIIFPVPGYTKDYLTDEELENTFKLYAGKCSQCDKWVGVFLDKVRELGMMDDTLIVFVSDHGEPFGEHGFVRKAFPFPYIEETQIPLIIRHPEGVGAGKRSNGFTMTPDLFSTILDFLSIRQPRKTHGKSLLPVMRGDEEELWEFALSCRFQAAWRIHTHEHVFIRYLVKDKPNELYDITNDPQEQKNLIEDQKDLAEELNAKLQTFAEGLR